MSQSAFSRHKNRIKNAALAILFAGTQVLFPIINSGVVHAAQAANIDQWGNKAPVGWQNGNLNENNSAYREGESVPFRSIMTGLANGTHTLDIEYDNVDSGKHAYDYLTSFDRNYAPDPCAGVVMTCTAGTPGAIPTDPTLGSVPQAAGQVKIYGANITSVVYLNTPGHNLSAARQTSIRVTFTTSNATAVIAWGGHIAKESDWGVGTGASSIPGSPYHQRILALDGTGGSQDRSLKASAVILLPRITITKVVQSGSALPSDFTFNVSPAINNQSLYSIPVGSNSVTIFDVVPDGNYTITENVVNGYGFVSGSGTRCTFNGSTATATVAQGTAGNLVNASCTFTNGQLPSSITIVKDAIPNSLQDFAFTATGTGVSNFTLDDDNGVAGADATYSNNKQFTNLTPGVYTFSESAVSGWDFDKISCSEGSSVQKVGSTVTITLAAGQNVTCTYTNRQRGTITVHKVTLPANDPTGFSVTASGTGNIAGNATRTLTTSQDVTYDVSQGTYSVSEDLSNTPGWTQTSNTCTNLVISSSNLSASCTITNTKLAKLKIVKDAVPNSAQDFAFTTSGTGLSAFSLDDDADATLPNNQQFTNLAPGVYTVTEGAILDANNQPLWDLTGLTCTGTTSFSRDGSKLTVTLAAGDDITCTFTNTQRGSISGVKYEANADSSTVGTLSGWTINLLLDGQIVATDTTDANGAYSFTNLQAGLIYTLQEVLQSGFTQIFAPVGTFTSVAGQDVNQGTDFGNFVNASISGYKWNDLNGDTTKNENESKIPGWTINLYNDNDDQDALLNNLVATTTTNVSGNYSFTNLAPGSYKVCEATVAGWTQTYPTTTDGCHFVTVALSGHDYTDNNFGNQGRGTIQVIKNVDTDGDGKADITGSTDWKWDINGTGNYATGSVQNVAAGSYTISEQQKTDYHFTSVICTLNGREFGVTQAENLGQVAVTAGDSIVCTYLNTRNTGTVTVIKNLVPSTDDGLFNLNINGTTYAANVGDGGTTGAITVPTGEYTASETAGTDTSLDDYTSYYVCSNEDNGSGTTTESFTVSTGQNVTCTFTNTRHASITVVKHTNPTNDPQVFDFTLSQYQGEALVPLLDNSKQFKLDDNDESVLPNSNTTDHLQPGTYFISEDELSGWDLTNIYCGEGIEFVQEGATIAVTISAGENITCTFTNTKRGSITIVKDAQPDSTQAFSFTASNGEEELPFTLTDDGKDASKARNTFDNLTPGTYRFSEASLKGWTLSDIVCSSENVVADEGTENGIIVRLQAGENVTCTFKNTRDMGTITVTKKLTPATDTGKFNLLINGVTYAVNVGDNGTTGAIELPTGEFTVSELGGTNTDLGAYESSYICTNGDVTLTSGASTVSGTFTLNKGDNIVCTFKNNKGEVLGVTTQELVNTGSNTLFTSIAAMTFITAVAGLALATRRLQNPTSR